MQNQSKKISVYQYWPNRVDYLRFVCLAVGICLFVSHPMVCLSLIILSCLLDALDGLLARKLNQSSVLGSALDFAIDRITTAAIVVLIIRLYPQYWLCWLFILLLDSASHFMHLYASLPSSHSNHKDMDASENKMLKQYYTNRTVLFTSCLVHELFFCFIYLYFFYSNPWMLILVGICAIGFIHKTIIHVLQIISAIKKLARASEAQGGGEANVPGV